MLRYLLLALTLSTLPAADPPWLGLWQEDKAPDDVMLLEHGRCVLKNPGQDPVYACAAYGPGELWARSVAGRFHTKFTFVGGRLTIVSGGSGTYHCLDAPPPGFLVAPLPIPAAKKTDADRIAAISAEAAKRLEEDQAVRKDPARGKDMAAVDAANTAWVKTVVAETGWTDATRFGKATASAMFLFVQHSGSLPLMLGALPCIERDLKAKACDPQDFALLYDRVQVTMGLPQRYGSQIVPDGNGQVVFLLEDRARVDQLRAGIGLTPLKAYLQVFEQQSKAKVGFMETVRFAD